MMRRHYNEYSHAPTWINTFDPADKKDVRRVLERVRGFVMVNRQIVKLSKLFENGEKALDTHINLKSTASLSCVKRFLSTVVTGHLAAAEASAHS